jgi:hypothetical protein
VSAAAHWVFNVGLARLPIGRNRIRESFDPLKPWFENSRTI